jgi:menaquinone-dependent protoporphyrinogen IX oxidase
MKIWIIYNDHCGRIKLFAEKLADFLESSFDVNVANSKRIKPSIIFEESPEVLIYMVYFINDSQRYEMEKWIEKFYNLSKEKNVLKIFSFIVRDSDDNTSSPWYEFLKQNYGKERIFEKISDLFDLFFRNSKFIVKKRTLKQYSEYIMNELEKVDWKGDF